MAHPNSRLTPPARLEIVAEAEAGWPWGGGGAALPRLADDGCEVGTSLWNRPEGCIAAGLEKFVRSTPDSNPDRMDCPAAQ